MRLDVAPAPSARVRTLNWRWAPLRQAGIRTASRRVRRVMGEQGLLAPHRTVRTEAKAHDGTIVTDQVNEMWERT